MGRFLKIDLLDKNWSTQQQCVKSLNNLKQDIVNAFVNPQMDKSLLLCILVGTINEDESEEQILKRCQTLANITKCSRESQLKLELIFENIERKINHRLVQSETERRNFEKLVVVFFESLKTDKSIYQHHAMLDTIEGMKRKLFFGLLYLVVSSPEHSMTNKEAVDDASSEKPTKKQKHQKSFSCNLADLIVSLLHILDCESNFYQVMMKDGKFQVYNCLFIFFHQSRLLSSIFVAPLPLTAG